MSDRSDPGSDARITKSEEGCRGLIEWGRSMPKSKKIWAVFAVPKNKKRSRDASAGRGSAALAKRVVQMQIRLHEMSLAHIELIRRRLSVDLECYRRGRRHNSCVERRRPDVSRWSRLACTRLR